VRTLFEMEVPEIYDGTVAIKAIARDPGSRTKVAVTSLDSNVDAVGACVGLKGSRVRAVVEELNGEKIDIVRWSANPVELCKNALNPADILDIRLNAEMQRIHVVVPQDQLSLAIGKRGQNARLASQLLGWNIDISGDDEDDDDDQNDEEPVAPVSVEINAAAADISDAGDEAALEADSSQDEGEPQTEHQSDEAPCYRRGYRVEYPDVVRPSGRKDVPGRLLGTHP